MRAETVTETVAEMRSEIIHSLVTRRIPEKAFSEQWELTELAEDVRRVLGMDIPIEAWGREEGIDETGLRERIEATADSVMAAKAANLGPELMRYIEKSLLLQVLDAVWKEHLLALDHLRQGIGLRAYGQKDPLNEYKSEAFALFNAMLDELKERVTSMLSRVELAPAEPAAPDFSRTIENHPDPEPMLAGYGDGGTALLASPPARMAVDANDPATWGQTSRNALCPCGSGKKFKHCHGRL